MNNFFSLFGFAAGMAKSAIVRLMKGSLGLSDSNRELWDNIRKITHPGKVHAYRQLYATCAGAPQLPHLAVVCQDIFRYEDSNKPKDKQGYVNFMHFWLEYGILKKTIKACKHFASDYNLTEENGVVDELCELMKMTQEKAFTLEDDDFMAKSYEICPPKSKAVYDAFKKKIARKNAKKAEEEAKKKAEEEKKNNKKQPGITHLVIAEETATPPVVLPETFKPEAAVQPQTAVKAQTAVKVQGSDLPALPKSASNSGPPGMSLKF